jgi:shikimate kinase
VADETGLYVVMGVSGSGKTVIGSALARSLGVEFVEGDELHPEENVKRMASGIALTDRGAFARSERRPNRIGGVVLRTQAAVPRFIAR